LRYRQGAVEGTAPHQGTNAGRVYINYWIAAVIVAIMQVSLYRS
jgi:hypothetical protein